MPRNTRSRSRVLQEDNFGDIPLPAGQENQTQDSQTPTETGAIPAERAAPAEEGAAQPIESSDEDIGENERRLIAEQRDLEALEKRLAIADRKAELLLRLRDRNLAAIALEEESSMPRPPPLEGDPAQVPELSNPVLRTPAIPQPPPTAAGDRDDDAVTVQSGETSQVREPRSPSNMPVFHGKTTDEWDMFKAKQEAFWARYPRWFASDEARVARVTEFLSNKVTQGWMQYRKNNPAKQITWDTFETWALTQVADPAQLQREAKADWWRATQRPEQSVHQYAQHLTGIYNRLRSTPSDQARIDRLETGILREIQTEARRWDPPKTEVYNK